MPPKPARLFLPFLLIPLLLSGADKEKKAYELIYKDVQLLKQQILELGQSIVQNRKDIEAIKGQADELLTLIREIQSQQVSMREEQKRIPSQIQVLLEKLEGMTLQLSRFSEDLLEIRRAALPILRQAEEQAKQEESVEEKPPPEEQAAATANEEEEKTGEPEIPSLPPDLSPQEIYNMAYADYLKGNFQLAIEGFKTYLEHFPQSPFADNALYWIGECYFSQQEYDKAIERYNQLILTYPLGDKVAAGYLHKGISLMELGKKEEALAVFKLLVTKYPLEEETKIAQEKIKELVGKQ